MEYASRIRFNMGQVPDKYFDLAYVREIVAHIDRCIAANVHNEEVRRNTPFQRYSVDHWRNIYRFDGMVEAEFEIQQLEQLLSEIELCFQWGKFSFQQKDGS